MLSTKINGHSVYVQEPTVCILRKRRFHTPQRIMHWMLKSAGICLAYKDFSVSLPGTIYDTSWSVMGYSKQQVASDFGGRQNGGENISGEPLWVQQAHAYFAYKYYLMALCFVILRIGRLSNHNGIAWKLWWYDWLYDWKINYHAAFLYQLTTWNFQI